MDTYVIQTSPITSPQYYDPTTTNWKSPFYVPVANYTDVSIKVFYVSLDLSNTHNHPSHYLINFIGSGVDHNNNTNASAIYDTHTKLFVPIPTKFNTDTGNFSFQPHISITNPDGSQVNPDYLGNNSFIYLKLKFNKKINDDSQSKRQKLDN